MTEVIDCRASQMIGWFPGKPNYDDINVYDIVLSDLIGIAHIINNSFY